MHSEEHAGLTLILTSLAMIPFGNNANAILVVVFTTSLSALPDIDLKWQKRGLPIHRRGITHSLLFALLIGTGFGGLLYYVYTDVGGFLTGFLSGFLGIVSHLVGDAFTYHRFKPLYPLSDRLVGLGWFSAGDKRINKLFLQIGILSFIGYLVLITGIL